MRRQITLYLILLGSLVQLIFSGEHESRFEMTEKFIREQWRHPVRVLSVRPLGAGSVHGEADDCEIHVGAELVDASISNYPDIVIEPPNICKDTTKSKTAWRAYYNGAASKTCKAEGFVRVWPELLDNGAPPSNPAHFMELHPLLKLNCPSSVKIDFHDKLKAYGDLGYKDAALISSVFGSFRLWIRRTPHPDDEQLTSIAFDYYVCNREGTSCGNRQSVPNFARLEIRPIPDTLRSVQVLDASVEPFKTLIARSRSYSGEDEGTVGAQVLVKLYGLAGTDFYDALGTGQAPDHSFDVLSIFTLDPLSVIKTIDSMNTNHTNDWTKEQYPLAMIVFGQMPAEQP